MRMEHRHEKELKEKERQLRGEIEDFSVVEESPSLWFGTFKKLKGKDSGGGDRYGVEIRTTNETPQGGDCVTIRSKKGDFWFGKLGVLEREFEYRGEYVHHFELVYRRKDDQIAQFFNSVNLDE